MDLNEIYTELWSNNSMVVYHPFLNDDGEPTMLATVYVANHKPLLYSAIEVKLYSFASANAGRKDVHLLVRELCFDFIKQKMNEGIDEHRN